MRHRRILLRSKGEPSALAHDSPPHPGPENSCQLFAPRFIALAELKFHLDDDFDDLDDDSSFK